jgi:hypothetical protein
MQIYNDTITSSTMVSSVGGAERPGLCGSEQAGIWKRLRMPGKNACDKPTQFDGVGAHGRSISIDLDRPD